MFNRLRFERYFSHHRVEKYLSKHTCSWRNKLIVSFEKCFQNRVLLNHAPSSTHLHPAPTISTQLISTSIHLSIHPALCNTLNVIRTFEPSISHLSGNFPRFRPKNSKLFILTENWPMRKLGCADSKSGLSSFSFLGKFGSKKSKLPILPENWHTWYLEDVDSYSVNSFLNFLPEIYFWANLDWKCQSC